MGVERINNLKKRCKKEVYSTFQERKGPNIASLNRAGNKEWLPLLKSDCLMLLGDKEGKGFGLS